MCLIIDRPAYATIDTKLLHNGLCNNPDGWGIMAGMGEDLLIKRGVEPDSFWDAYKDFDGTACTIHFRWATHGSKALKNTHPFTICDGRYAVMHNGMIDQVECDDPNRSDTFHFARRLLQPVLRKNPEMFGTKALTERIEKYVGTYNKLVILRNDGEKMFIDKRQGLKYDQLWLSNAESLPLGTEDFWGLEDVATSLSVEEIAVYCEQYPEDMARMIQEHFSQNWEGYDYQ
jgi:hypothetical protein